MNLLETAFDAFALHVRERSIPFQLLSTALFPVPVYLSCAALLHLLSGEFRTTDFSSVKRQVWHSTLSLTAVGPIAAAWHYLLLNNYAGNIYWSVAERGWLYFGASLVLYVLAMDTVFYWFHRVLHLPFFYKRFHAAHHRYHPTSTFAATAIDFWDIFSTGVVPVCCPPLFFPVHVAVFFFYVWLSLVWSLYLHNVSIGGGSSGGVINTNAAHAVHHQTGFKNYAVFTTLWDRLCGTYRAP